MAPSLPQTPNADRPDPRATRLDRLEQENATLRAGLDDLRADLNELRSIVRVLTYTLGWDAEALGFPPDVTR